MQRLKTAWARLKRSIIKAHLKAQIEANRAKINELDRERTLKLQHINELTRDSDRARAKLQALNSRL